MKDITPIEMRNIIDDCIRKHGIKATVFTIESILNVYKAIDEMKEREKRK